MKNVKQIYITLAILMALIFTGMQNLNAQATVHVEWSEEGCECTISGNYYYRVDIEIIDQCGDDHHTVYSDFVFVNGPTNYADILLEYTCLDTSLEPCYLVVADVKKYCPDGHGGYTLTCDGKHPGEHVSCNDLMNSIVPIPLTGILLN